MSTHGNGGTRATLFILAAHFAKQKTKFSGGGKIGIGKRGQTKIIKIQRPDFLWVMKLLTMILRM